MTGGLIGARAAGRAGRETDFLTPWLAERPAYFLAGCLAGRLGGWKAELMTPWLAG